MEWFINNSVPGQITIAAAGTVPLSGIGEFLYIQFEILQSGFSPISFTDEENNFFNEGTPSIVFENGSVSNPTSIPEPEIDLPHIVLLQSYPNPFRYSTTISFNINDQQNKKIKIEIYNIKGQKIRQFSIFNNQSSIIWNGTDDQGIQVANGIYFYLIQDNDVSGMKQASSSNIKKLIYLK